MLKSVFRRLGLLLPLLMVATALAGPHKLRVTDRALAESLIAQGGKLLADYKSFQLIEVEETLSTKIAADRAQLVDSFNSIELNAQSLNTRAPEIQALRKVSGAFNGRRLQLVQFVGPIKPEWRAALERTGVKIVSYLPQNAYLVYGDAPALAQLQAGRTRKLSCNGTANTRANTKSIRAPELWTKRVTRVKLELTFSPSNSSPTRTRTPRRWRSLSNGGSRRWSSLRRRWVIIT